MIGMSVSRQSPAIGKTIEAAGLRGLDDVFITSVKRGDQVRPCQACMQAFKWLNF